jgi:hypothetical protein
VLAGLVASTGCGLRRTERVVEFGLPTVPAWLPAGGVLSHRPLAQPLTMAWARPGRHSLKPDDRASLYGYVSLLARCNPALERELFPTDAHVVAYLVDAHIAWTLLLNQDPRLADADVETLRHTAFPLAQGSRTLADLEVEILGRSFSEPRVALALNPGWRGGPPLPAAPFESHSLAWQIGEHARRCGSTTGFWRFDPARKTLAVSAFTTYLPGLPQDQGSRVRRLIDLVPPAEAEARAILATCGDRLGACALAYIPVDSRRF